MIQIQITLYPYEMLYGRPFVYVNDLFLDPEVQTLQSYTIAMGQFQQDIHLWGMNQDPKDSKESPLYAPGTQVLIKVWKDGSPKAQLQPTWKGTRLLETGRGGNVYNHRNQQVLPSRVLLASRSGGSTLQLL